MALEGGREEREGRGRVVVGEGRVSAGEGEGTRSARLGIHYRGVQSEGGAVDGRSIR